MTARVRDATEADLDGLLAIEDAFRAAGVSRWQIVPEPVMRRKVAAREVSVVTGEDDGVAGYLMHTLLWGYAWIEYARLLEPHRRRGLGRAMVEALEERLRGEGHRMLFSSVTGGEEGPMAWHAALGFERCGEITWTWPAPVEVVLVKGL